MSSIDTSVYRFSLKPFFRSKKKATATSGRKPVRKKPTTGKRPQVIMASRTTSDGRISLAVATSSSSGR